MRRSVSTPRSSNRTCGFPASGFRTKVMSCFRPREVGCGSRQLHQSQRSVKVFVRITASSGTSDFMFPTQPLTQPITAMSVHCAIDFAHRSKAKVIAPTPKQRIEFFYLLGRFAAQGRRASLPGWEPTAFNSRNFSRRGAAALAWSLPRRARERSVFRSICSRRCNALRGRALLLE